MKLSSIAVTTALLAASAHAFNLGGKEPPKPTVDLVKGFRWKNPFSSEAIAPYEAACEATVNFSALEYTLHELMHPHPEGLKPWAKGLKKFFSGREYPGGWFGLDFHLHDRSLLFMEYRKLPLPVREWIEEQDRTDGEGKGLFAVFEKPESEEDEIDDVVNFASANELDRLEDKQKVAIFAPGSLYDILPLWVAETSKCKDDLVDLTKYKPEPEEGGVVAWAEHTLPEQKQILIQIKAQVLKGKPSTDEESKKSKTASREEL
ncbi:hypothetical protein G7046_g8718 [Stylonectria norvegica]|nr:hypothetical protein G7046_g8718 [Stylonectria norvegica]